MASTKEYVVSRKGIRINEFKDGKIAWKDYQVGDPVDLTPEQAEFFKGKVLDPESITAKKAQQIADFPIDYPYAADLLAAGVKSVKKVPITKSGLISLNGIGDAKADAILKYLESKEE